jgi:hypothetical protein
MEARKDATVELAHLHRAAHEQAFPVVLIPD